jgi:hypothetical protein
MWYGFYGETLSSVSMFDGRMDALCREIGSRGRADAMAAADPACEAGSDNIVAAAADAPLALELQGMKGSLLRKRAISSGVSEAELEETDDADDTKAALIKLILARELADADTARAELLAMKTSLLRKKAIAMGVSPEAIEAADDAADLKAALADLILAAQPSG